MGINLVGLEKICYNNSIEFYKQGLQRDTSYTYPVPLFVWSLKGSI